MRNMNRGLIAFAIAALTAAGPPAAAQENTFWEVLGDTTLTRLLQEAERGSFELQAATARVEGASAARLSATLDLLPAVTASAGYTRRRFASSAFPGAGAGSFPDQDVWESGLSAAWELDMFGRVRHGLSAREAILESTESDARTTGLSVAAQVARSYFDMRGAQSRLEVARRNAENQRRTLHLTELRLEAGRGTELDVERARAQLAFTLSAMPLLEAHVAHTQHRIAVLVGRPIEDVVAELSWERALPEFPESVPGLTVSDLMRVRPDLQSSEGTVQATRALVRSAKADYLPRISLVAGAGYSASAFDAFGNRGTFNYAVGPVISWAAFDLGRVKARVDEARSFEMEARARHEDAALRAREEIENAAVRYSTAKTRLALLERSAEASERAADLAARRYEAGAADFLQVLDAERTLLIAQDELAAARADVAAAYVGLFESRAGAWDRS